MPGTPFTKIFATASEPGTPLVRAMDPLHFLVQGCTQLSDRRAQASRPLHTIPKRLRSRRRVLRATLKPLRASLAPLQWQGPGRCARGFGGWSRGFPGCVQGSGDLRVMPESFAIQGFEPCAWELFVCSQRGKACTQASNRCVQRSEGLRAGLRSLCAGVGRVVHGEMRERKRVHLSRIAHRRVLFEDKVRTTRKASSGMAIA